GEKRPERDEKTEKMSKKTCRIFEIFKRDVNQNPLILIILLHIKFIASKRFHITSRQHYDIIYSFTRSFFNQNELPFHKPGKSHLLPIVKHF
ncbi:MAG: hypothetical protein WBC40_01920, partial [Halobacteriota archaeon]